MARKSQRSRQHYGGKCLKVLPNVLWIAAWLAVIKTSAAQLPPTTVQNAGAQNSGAIGSRHLAGGGVDIGYFQPVQIIAPPGVRVSVAMPGGFDVGDEAPVTVGLLRRQAYRFQLSGQLGGESQVVYPSIEVIDRLHPPAGKKTRYPIPIELTLEEIRMALDGMLVTRVIYLEDPRNAVPHGRNMTQPQNYFDVLQDENPVEVARELGRPMAILRIGSRIPGPGEIESGFLFASPPVERYETVIETPPELAPVVTPQWQATRTPGPRGHRPAVPFARSVWPRTR